MLVPYTKSPLVVSKRRREVLALNVAAPQQFPA
jgi:hypothetical protein